MTRINVGVDVKSLTNKHLLAEAREIKRIPNMVSKGRCNLKNIPDKFTLGKGHVSFFYDKLKYLRNRYDDLYKECKFRGFNVQDYSESWNNVPTELMNDYIPTTEDIQIVEERIAERLSNPISKQKQLHGSI
jgi:hypothetical protein